MPASEAQVRANQANAAKSTGPKTPEGKDASRANSYKHGLTATKVLPQIEAAEVQRRYVAFSQELKPSGEVGMVFVLRAAVMSARMERCVEYETAALTDRVRRAEAEFVPPEGVDEATAARLRSEAGRRALFDDSKGATLARKYEAAAERSFFRAIKELRQHERAVHAAEADQSEEELASISPGEMSDEEFDRLEAEFTSMTPRKPSHRVETVDPSPSKGPGDVPSRVVERR